MSEPTEPQEGAAPEPQEGAAPEDAEMLEDAEILTVGKAAARLGVTKAWVHRLIKGGRLPAVKRTSPLGDYWEIRASDLHLVRSLAVGRPRKEKQQK